MPAPPMMNLNDLEMTPFEGGGHFAAQLGAIGRPLGMQKFGCGLVVLQPGKRAWPLHEHYGNEELFIILSGEGTIRYGDGEYPVKANDVIYTPTGKGTAHQIVNTSDAELRYQRSLAILERALGPEHPNVAQSLKNYAGLLRETGRGEEAEEMEARVLAIRAKHAKQNPG